MTARVNGARPTPRRRAAAEPAPAPTVSRAPFEPFSFAKRAPAEDAPRIPLFDIDGTEYTVPAVVEVPTALMLLGVVKRLDERQAGLYLIQELAGEKAFAALLGEATFQHAEWKQLIEVLWQHAFGQLEAAEPGN